MGLLRSWRAIRLPRYPGSATHSDCLFRIPCFTTVVRAHTCTTAEPSKIPEVKPIGPPSSTPMIGVLFFPFIGGQNLGTQSHDGTVVTDSSSVGRLWLGIQPSLHSHQYHSLALCRPSPSFPPSCRLDVLLLHSEIPVFTVLSCARVYYHG